MSHLFRSFGRTPRPPCVLLISLHCPSYHSSISSSFNPPPPNFLSNTSTVCVPSLLAVFFFLNLSFTLPLFSLFTSTGFFFYPLPPLLLQCYGIVPPGIAWPETSCTIPPLLFCKVACVSVHLTDEKMGEPRSQRNAGQMQRSTSVWNTVFALNQVDSR